MVVGSRKTRCNKGSPEDLWTRTKKNNSFEHMLVPSLDKSVMQQDMMHSSVNKPKYSELTPQILWIK